MANLLFDNTFLFYRGMSNMIGFIYDFDKDIPPSLLLNER